jgi:dihydrodipicolinate synthase/N-acetylneuraminate lyase
MVYKTTKASHTSTMNFNDNNQPFPLNLIRPKRKITGMSAILLPFWDEDSVDWDGLKLHIERTRDAGLVPAVNMDTGYANLLDESTRREVLGMTRFVMAGDEFVAGAFVGDSAGSEFDFDAYRQQIDSIHEFGGTPIIFQSYGLAHGSDEQIVENYRQIASHCPRFIGFELGAMFARFGNIYSIDVYKQLMEIPQCIGAKHSSLRRDLEWNRIEARNQLRPEFMVLTGNDLAIDMVTYGSDYLLGLSTFCPDLFAYRDQLWEAGDPDFYQLNDVLQYLGFFAFRNPTSAYKHTAAMFLNQRGWIKTDLTHPKSIQRPWTDRAILREIGRQLGLEMNA